jgi:hypothetical protein
VAHNADTNEDVRRAADERFPPKQRRAFLRLLERGVAISEAAEKVGITVQAVHARCRFDPEWQGLLDAALIAGRDPDAPYGTPTGYRRYRCRCPDCRRAHHPVPA